MAWTSSGDFLTLTDKEKIISNLEDNCKLSDESCLALKQLKIADLRRLYNEINKALDDAYEGGKQSHLRGQVGDPQ